MTGVVIFLFASLTAIGVLGWQSIVWLRTGGWPELSVLDTLIWSMGSHVDSWLLWPTSWLGLHKLLAMAPLSGSVFAVGLLSMWIGITFADNK